jgi:hypothetical protein
MRQFTQFAQAAGGGVAFQGMHRAPDDANDFLVSGLFFQLQRFVVQCLQQLLRSLKEELPQFRAPFIVRLVHALSLISRRW